MSSCLAPGSHEESVQKKNLHTPQHVCAEAQSILKKSQILVATYVSSKDVK